MTIFARNPDLFVTVAGTPAEVTYAGSVTFDGVTFTFDRLMPVGFFKGWGQGGEATGEPFVVSEQAFQITAISPAATPLNGYVANGAMLNPVSVESSGQGFDELHQHFDRDGTIPSNDPAVLSYTPALNIDPGVNGPIAVALGQKASVVKQVRRASKTGVTGWRHAEKYVTLTVLDQAPPTDSFRPGISGTTKTIRAMSDVVFTPRGLPLPASFPTVTDIANAVPDNLAAFSGNGEKRRTLRTDGTTGTGYSGELTDDHARFVYALNASSLTNQQREAFIARTITFGNDVEAGLDAGMDLQSGAGQGGAIWLWGMAAAALLRDASLHAKIRAARLQPENAFWVKPLQVGSPVTGKAGAAAQTYFDEHVGMPHIEPDEAGSHFGARYLHIGAHITAWETVSILGFTQGPAGFANGYEMVLNGGPDDETNDNAALVAFCARYAQWEPNSYSSYDVQSSYLDAYQQVAGSGDFVPWTGRPEQPPSSLGSFTAGDGLIMLTRPVGYDYATEPVTRSDMRITLDGVQWIEQTGINLAGNTFIWNGLLKGAYHRCGWRNASASGTGLWSGNFPYGTPIDDGDHRNEVTTTGSMAATAPSYAGGVAPEVHTRAAVAWEYETWAPVTGVLDLNDVVLAAGVGYPSAAYPAPAFAFQWQRSDNGTSGWSDISGATQATYTRTAADAEKFLRCEITASNASGAAVATTNVVECPALQIIPAGTLIDTDFKGAFAVDYAAERDSLDGSGYEVTHKPGAAPGAVPGTNVGGIEFQKLWARPTGRMTIDRQAAANTTYDVAVEAVVEGTTSSTPVTVTLREVGGADLLEFDLFREGGVVQVQPDDGNQNYFVERFELTSQITIGGTARDLQMEVGYDSSTGGGSGPRPTVTRLTITEA